MNQADPPLPPVPANVLLVEDNAIIALDVEHMLHTLGVAVVRSAATVEEALALIAERAPDFALLDVRLGNDTSFGVADKLAELSVRFAFVSGYGDRASFPPRFAAARTIVKPYAADALLKALLGT